MEISKNLDVLWKQMLSDIMCVNHFHLCTFGIVLLLQNAENVLKWLCRLPRLLYCASKSLMYSSSEWFNVIFFQIQCVSCLTCSVQGSWWGSRKHNPGKGGRRQSYSSICSRCIQLRIQLVCKIRWTLPYPVQTSLILYLIYGANMHLFRTSLKLLHSWLGVCCAWPAVGLCLNLVICVP